jgi:uncharacterized OB-fold protein
MSAKDDRYNSSEKGRARWRRYRRKQYDRLKAEGLCTHCGKEELYDESVCVFCRAYKQEWRFLQG